MSPALLPEPTRDATEALLRKVSDSFHHPAIVLWRTRELAVVSAALPREPEKRMLDLAGGEGYVSRALFGPHGCAVGIDLLEDGPRVAWRTGAYSLGAVRGDATRLPFTEDAFDVVFSNSSIEHIPDLHSVLAGVRRVLREGGLFVFTVPAPQLAETLFFHRVLRTFGLRRAASQYSTARNRRLEHHHLYSHEIWATKLEAMGLECVGYRYYLSPGHTSLWDVLAALGVLARAARLGLLLNVPGASRTWRSLVRALLRPAVLGQEDGRAGSSLLVIARRA